MKLFNTKYLKPKQIYKNLKGLLKREFKKIKVLTKFL